MNSAFWIRMHGGATHLPIALTFASAVFDLAGSLLPDDAGRSRRADLRAAGFYTLALAALGAFGGVISGLVLSHGQLWGRGNLARHHLFLWPGFGLLIALAVWRAVAGSRASPLGFRIYLAVVILAATSMGAAGFWGGELLLNG